MKRINIIYKDNGVGLTHDAAILQSALPDCRFNLISIEPGHKFTRKPADVNIFLEVIDMQGQLFSLAPLNYYIPNPEWFEIHSWRKFLHRFDLILAKTHDCEKIFGQIVGYKKVVYTSFTSFDKYDSMVEKKMLFGHFAGRSDTKNSKPVYDAWAKHKIPTKLIYCKHGTREPSRENIHVISERIENETMKQLMNACIFHLCPSQYEGFGHYINEAKSCGAIVITTDAAPMNEFVNNQFGTHILSMQTKKKELGLLHIVDSTAVWRAAERVLGYDVQQILKMSKNSRNSYLENDRFFRNKIKEVLL